MDRQILSDRPLARREDLIQRTAGDETLVYDLRNDRAHCLNPVASAVWALCTGTLSVADIAETASLAPEDVLHALVDLEGSDLLQTSGTASPGVMSRRALLVKAGFGAAIAVPLVTSIVVPTAAQAGSLGGHGAPCTTSAQCASGVCSGGACE